MKCNNKLLFLFLLPAVLLCGCYDNREMEDRDYVITMGIDKNVTNPDGNSLYNVSLGSANLSAMASKPEEEESAKTASLVVSGNSLASALRRADAYSSTQIYLGQLKTVVLGKTLLADKMLLTSVLDELERNRDISEKIILLGAEGDAAEYVEAILSENDTTGLFIWNFFKNTSEDVAITKAVHLEDFLRDLRDSGGQSIIPKINLEQKKLRLGGGMALANYQYIGSLRDAEQRGYLFMQGNGEGAVLEAKWEESTIPLWLYKNNSKISFSEQSDQLVCHIKVTGDGSIEGNNILQESIFNDETIKEMENLFESNIKTEIENTIKLARQDFGKDIFQFGVKLKQQNPDLYYKYWRQPDSIPSEMVIDIDAKIRIRTIGVIE